MGSDPTISQKTLEQFFEDLEERVSRGEIKNTASWIAEAETYPRMLEYFSTHPEITSELLVSQTNEESLRATNKLIEDKKLIFQSETPSLTQFHRGKETPVAPVSPVRERALGNTGESILERRRRVTAQSAERRRHIAREFVTQCEKRKLYGSPEEIEKAIEKELSEPVYAKTPDETKQALVELIVQAPEFSQNRYEATVMAEDVLNSNREFVNKTWEDTRSEVAAVSVITKDPSIVDTKTFVEALDWKGGNIQEATRAARVSTVVNAYEIDSSGVGLAQLVPGVHKDATLEQAFAEVWEKTVNAPAFMDAITSRIGAEAVGSEIFANIMRSGNDTAQQAHAAQSIAGGIVKVGEDIFTSVRPPPTKEATDYIAAIYNKHARTGTNPEVSQYEFFIAVLYANNPDSFSIGETLSGWALRWGAESAAKGAIKEGGKTIVKEVAKKGLMKTIMVGLGAALGGPLGIVVGWLGDVVLTKVLAFGGAVLGGAASAFKFLASADILNGKSPPMSLMFMAVPVFVCIIFVMLSLKMFTFYNPKNLGEQNRQSALVTSYDIGGGPESVGVIDCNQRPGDPLCNVEPCVMEKAGDCAWPTTGTLTQGPYAQCVIGGEKWSTHDRLNAVDIAAPYGTTVISIKSGEIVAWRSGCPDKPGGGNSTSFGCNGGWGNYVDVASSDGYVLRYGHLALGSMSLTRPHMKVNQGQVIGKVDNNGNSYGNHLHFGIVTGPGGILSVLPLSPADANRVNRCALNSNCPIMCPRIHASTQ